MIWKNIWYPNIAALVVMMTWRRSPWSCRWRRRGNQLQQRRILCRMVRTNVDICDTLSFTTCLLNSRVSCGRGGARDGRVEAENYLKTRRKRQIFFYKFSRSKVANGVPLATLLRVCISWNVNFLISHLIVFSSFFDWKLQNIALDIVINILNLMIFLEKPCLILL